MMSLLKLSPLAAIARVSAWASLIAAMMALVLLSCSQLQPGSSGPDISNVTVTSVTQTTAEISWGVSPEGTGQVEFGETNAYGRFSTLEPELLPFHVQELDGLTVDQIYHFRVISSDSSGAMSWSGDMTFATDERPIQAVAETGIYGSGIGADSKDNMLLDGASVSHRFRASTSAGLQSVQFQQRGGPGYSLGDGGSVRVSVQTNRPGSLDAPSGEILSSVTVRPGNPAGDWTTYERYEFDQPAELTKGLIYHIVFENLDREPAANHISVNEIFTFERYKPRQPATSDDYAVLTKSGTAWQVEPHDTADMALEYRDGTVDGQAYIENMCALYGVVSGPQSMARENFKVSGVTRTVSEAWVRVKRTYGDAPLTIALKSGDDEVLATAEIPARSVAVAGEGCTQGGATWVKAQFGQEHDLTHGETYNLELSAPSTSQYTVDPIREGTDQGMLSYRFTDGDGQRTEDGGKTWANLYEWSPVDLQFYFR